MILAALDKHQLQLFWIQWIGNNETVNL